MYHARNAGWSRDPIVCQIVILRIGCPQCRIVNGRFPCHYRKAGSVTLNWQFLTIAVSLFLTACGGGNGSSSNRSHIFLIIMEKHGPQNIIGNPDAPFINKWS